MSAARRGTEQPLAARPNIVFIMADDMGLRDPGPYDAAGGSGPAARRKRHPWGRYRAVTPGSCWLMYSLSVTIPGSSEVA